MTKASHVILRNGLAVIGSPWFLWKRERLRIWLTHDTGRRWPDGEEPLATGESIDSLANMFAWRREARLETEF
jgi:hypothetical protein